MILGLCEIKENGMSRTTVFKCVVTRQTFVGTFYFLANLCAVRKPESTFVRILLLKVLPQKAADGSLHKSDSLHFQR